ncbi:predicted protein [Chaetoceros tenuissimus]|uniref:Uncharacterized protein n=1 Tax=Chaetoceros tenuissimus TaxID=426638 RepID=A0AAD3CY48_9STRA|nr:predicted protein [Chaetoceros tenuissimus]
MENSPEGLNIRPGKFTANLLEGWADDREALHAFLELDPYDRSIFSDMNEALQYAYTKDLVLVSYCGVGREVTIILDSSFAGKPAAVLYVDSFDASLVIGSVEFHPPSKVQAKLKEMTSERPSSLSLILEKEKTFSVEEDMIQGTPSAVAFFPRSIILKALVKEDGIYKMPLEKLFDSLLESVAELKDSEHYKPDSPLLVAAFEFAGLKQEGEVPRELVGMFSVSTETSSKDSVLELRTKYFDSIPNGDEGFDSIPNGDEGHVEDCGDNNEQFCIAGTDTYAGVGVENPIVSYFAENSAAVGPATERDGNDNNEQFGLAGTIETHPASVFVANSTALGPTTEGEEEDGDDNNEIGDALDFHVELPPLNVENRDLDNVFENYTELQKLAFKGLDSLLVNIVQVPKEDPIIADNDRCTNSEFESNEDADMTVYKDDQTSNTKEELAHDNRFLWKGNKELKIKMCSDLDAFICASYMNFKIKISRKDIEEWANKKCKEYKKLDIKNAKLVTVKNFQSLKQDFERNKEYSTFSQTFDYKAVDKRMFQDLNSFKTKNPECSNTDFKKWAKKTIQEYKSMDSPKGISNVKLERFLVLFNEWDSASCLGMRHNYELPIPNKTYTQQIQALTKKDKMMNKQNANISLKELFEKSNGLKRRMITEMCNYKSMPRLEKEDNLVQFVMNRVGEIQQSGIHLADKITFSHFIALYKSWDYKYIREFRNEVISTTEDKNESIVPSKQQNKDGGTDGNANTKQYSTNGTLWMNSPDLKEKMYRDVHSWMQVNGGLKKNVRKDTFRTWAISKCAEYEKLNSPLNVKRVTEKNFLTLYEGWNSRDEIKKFRNSLKLSPELNADGGTDGNANTKQYSTNGNLWIASPDLKEKMFRDVDSWMKANIGLRRSHSRKDVFRTWAISKCAEYKELNSPLNVEQVTLKNFLNMYKCWNWEDGHVKFRKSLEQKDQTEKRKNSEIGENEDSPSKIQVVEKIEGDVNMIVGQKAQPAKKAAGKKSLELNADGGTDGNANTKQYLRNGTLWMNSPDLKEKMFRDVHSWMQVNGGLKQKPKKDAFRTWAISKCAEYEKLNSPLNVKRVIEKNFLALYEGWNSQDGYVKFRKSLELNADGGTDGNANTKQYLRNGTLWMNSPDLKEKMFRDVHSWMQVNGGLKQNVRKDTFRTWAISKCAEYEKLNSPLNVKRVIEKNFLALYEGWNSQDGYVKFRKSLKQKDQTEKCKNSAVKKAQSAKKTVAGKKTAVKKAQPAKKTVAGEKIAVKKAARKKIATFLDVTDSDTLNLQVPQLPSSGANVSDTMDLQQIGDSGSDTKKLQQIGNYEEL